MKQSRGLRFVSTIMLWALVAVLASGLAVAESKTVTIWFVGSNQQSQENHEKVIAEFEALNPNIDVELEYIGWGEWSDRLTVSFAAGTAPDIFDAMPQAIGSYAEAGMIQPIDQFVAKMPDAKDFFPVALESSRYKGKLYGLPYSANVRSIFYRSDIFSEAGIQKPPATWDDLRTYYPKLAKVNEAGQVTRNAFGVAVDFHLWFALLNQAGGKYTTEDGNTPLFNSPQGLEAAKFYLDIYQLSRSYGPMISGSTLLSGNYVMEFGGQHWNLPTAKKKFPELVPHIKVAPPLKNKEQLGVIYWTPLSISAHSKNPQEAFKLVEWLTNSENSVKAAETTFSIPSRLSAVNSEYVRGTQLLMDIMELVIPVSINWPTQETKNQGLWKAEFQKVVNGEITPQQMLDTLERTFIPVIQK